MPVFNRKRDMQARVEAMSIEELMAEFERLLKAGDRTSAWTQHVRGS
jgi:hypothetical protein